MKGVHKFEKIENDVYTGGCKGIQPFEEKKVVEMSNQTDNSNNIAEDMPKTDSSSSFDVHILNLEESYIQGSRKRVCWYCQCRCRMNKYIQIYTYYETCIKVLSYFRLIGHLYFNQEILDTLSNEY